MGLLFISMKGQSNQIQFLKIKMEEPKWYELLVDGDDRMGVAVFREPSNETERQWVNTLKLNFKTIDVNNHIEVRMSLGLCNLLAHIPGIPVAHWVYEE